MSLNTHAAFFYPSLKRDADKAHAVLHGSECLCTQSLESMAEETYTLDDLEKAGAANTALLEAAQQAILSLRLIGSQRDVEASVTVRTVAKDAADALEQAIEAAKAEQPA